MPERAAFRRETGSDIERSSASEDQTAVNIREWAGRRKPKLVSVVFLDLPQVHIVSLHDLVRIWMTWILRGVACCPTYTASTYPAVTTSAHLIAPDQSTANQ